MHHFLSALLFTLLTWFSLSAFAQLPSVEVKNLKGQVVNVQSLGNDGQPFVINFWATWCKPCIKELDVINDLYLDWQEETGVKIFAISIDDARTSSLVRSMTMGRGWEYDILIDENGDLKRAMNVPNPPHTFLFDGEGNLVYQHNSYAPGDEEVLYDHIKKLIKGK